MPTTVLQNAPTRKGPAEGPFFYARFPSTGLRTIEPRGWPKEARLGGRVPSNDSAGSDDARSHNTSEVRCVIMGGASDGVATRRPSEGSTRGKGSGSDGGTVLANYLSLNMEKASAIRHLLELSKEEKKAFLDSFDTIMSDCDGVVWNFTGPIPGVDQGLQLLQKKGKKLMFISNNGMRTADEYKQKFHKLGIEGLLEQDIVHPALTTVNYLKSIDMQDAVFCIGTEVFKDYLRNAGFTVLDGPTERIQDDRTAHVVHAYVDFYSESNDHNVGAVVFDYDPNMCLGQLMKAYCYLERNPDSLLISGASDYYVPLGENMHLIGPGYFIDILERESGRQALVLGKPGQALAKFVLEQFHVTQPERTLFIGDSLPQDMGFAAHCGFQRLLVLSGGTTREMMLEHGKPNELPDYYANSFADFVQLYKDVE